MSDRTDSERDIRIADDAGREQGASRANDREVRVYPDLFLSGLTAIVLLLCAYSLLCIFAPAGLGPRANLLSPPAEFTPAWYLLFARRLLGSVPPPVRALAPVALLVLLGMWPFIDRNPSHRARERVLAVALAVVALAAVLVLSLLEWRA